jgi:putative oxidoreductase
MTRTLFQTNGGWAAFVLRIVLGIVFFAHGAQLALGWFGGQVFSESVISFGKMALPVPVAVLIILAQFLGSLGLLVGLLTRIAALGIFSVMVGAIYMVHLNIGFFMNWASQQQGEGYEYHLLVIAIALALMITGGGNLSLDKAIGTRSGESKH